jgi:hypothetical protein
MTPDPKGGGFRSILPTSRLLVGAIALLHASNLFAQIPVGTVQGSGTILRDGNTISVDTQKPLYPDDIISTQSGEAPNTQLFDTKSTHLQRLPSGDFRVIQEPPRGRRGLAEMVTTLVDSFTKLPASVQRVGRNGNIRWPTRTGPPDPVVPHPAADSMLLPGESVQFQWEGNPELLRFKTHDGGLVTAIPVTGKKSLEVLPEQIGLSPGNRYTWTAVNTGGPDLNLSVISESETTEIREGLKVIDSLGREPAQTRFLKGCYLAKVTSLSGQPPTYDLTWLAYQYILKSGMTDNTIAQPVIAEYRNRARGSQNAK